MKQPENNEIDSLLRSLASHERATSAGSAVNVTGAHLDADELNSYAEGGLPPSTRARYTSHLADCDDCRKIVAQLSIAAGPVITEAAKNEPSGTFSWRTMLAALLAPAVLRYAMPALVLVIISFTFFATRQQPSSVALDSGHSNLSPGAPPAGEITKEQPNSAASFADVGKNTAPSATRSPSAAKTGDERQKSTDAAKPNSSEAGNEKPKDQVAALAQPSYAPEPAPPPAVARPAPVSETKDSSQVASGVAQNRPASPRKREAGKQDDNKQGEKQTEKESEEARAGARGAAAEDAPAKGRDDDSKKAKTDKSAGAGMFGAVQSETRSVGGRHFQRRNGIWVDTAFNSSLSVTPVSRGSEQYRALVADEPGIDAIAKQLSGEIFLVWKGRGYRIH